MKKGNWLLSILVATALSGCASKDYVHDYVGGQIAPVNDKIKGLDGRVGSAENNLNSTAGGVSALGGRVGAVEGSLRDHDGRIVTASRTAREALDRAVAAGKLAEGKFVYEIELSDATALAFKFEGDELSAPARKTLDDFATRLKSENKNVFIEIQGHTDNIGGNAFNLKLGEERAEAVRRYLNLKGGVALHRMSIISYGEAVPVASNKTRAGREQNRRVVLVVLK